MQRRCGVYTKLDAECDQQGTVVVDCWQHLTTSTVIGDDCQLFAHNICIKIQQTAVVAITRKINLKYRGTLPWTSPLHEYWGTCPPCPIGIHAPACSGTSTGCPCDSAYCLRLLSSCSNVWPAKHHRTCQTIASLSLTPDRAVSGHLIHSVSYTHLTLPTILRV